MRYLLLLSVFAITSCSGQTKDCSKFKTGTFKYSSPEYSSQTIVRNDSIQIETNSKNNVEIVTSVEWVNECKYILTYVDVVNYPKKDEVIGKKITIDIISSDGNTYTCHAVSDAMDSKIEMIKVN